MSGYAKRMMEVAAAWLRANPDPATPIQLPLRGSCLDAEVVQDQIRRTDRTLRDARGTGDPDLIRRIEDLRERIVRSHDEQADQRIEARRVANRPYRLSQGKIDRLATRGDPILFTPEAHWLLAWARDGYNVFDLGADFCAAMLLTDQREVDLPSIRLPFRGMLFMIPDQFAIGAEGTSYTKVHVVDLEDSVEVDEDPGTVGRSRRPAIGIYATDDKRILFAIAPRDQICWTALEELPDTVTIDADREAKKTIQRIVLGAIAYATLVDRAIVGHDPSYRRKKSGRPTVQPIRYWTIGSTIRIQPELVRAARRGAREVALHIQRRFIVRGHYRNQAHGPAHSLRTSRWIAPFYKGPADGAQIVHTYIPSAPRIDGEDDRTGED